MPEAINLEGQRNQRLVARAMPSIESGEEVRGLFVGQTVIPPRYSYPLFFVAWLFSRGGAIVVTDREVYQFSMGFMGRLKMLRHKTPLGEAKAQRGGSWSLTVGRGPRLYALPGSGRGVRDAIAALINEPGAGSMASPD